MQLALSSFLAWFDGSQALERIIKLERRRHFSGEVVGGVVTTLLYMIKRVQYLQIDILSFLIVLKESGRQKMIAASLSKEKFATVCFPVIFPPQNLTLQILSRPEKERTCCQAVMAGTHGGC